jgi:hypothetical protein
MLAGLSAIARAAPQETDVDCWTKGDVPKSATHGLLRAASYDTNTDAKAILARNTITNEQTGVNLEYNVDWRTRGAVTMTRKAVHGAVPCVATGEGSGATRDFEIDKSVTRALPPDVIDNDNNVTPGDMTLTPSESPSDQPSVVPSTQPSVVPSDQPSVVPSDQPSVVPSDQPSVVPSNQPSVIPSNQPSLTPSESPSDQPLAQPSRSPSNQPSGSPSNHPSAQPSPLTSNLKSQKKSGQQALGSLLAPTSPALPQNSYYGKKSKGSEGYYMKKSKGSKGSKASK